MFPPELFKEDVYMLTQCIKTTALEGIAKPMVAPDLSDNVVAMLEVLVSKRNILKL